ncbi:hypothetical protein M404DRAFT_997535 [Pisolithus tinctorius Marx 270]|uniref:Conserved oligomeric Golgi complex subunit 1 n=1 Tax=Pisolithus tinctorius Marx 270 TaxID=870435 RepID=A0A0C3PK68_PISTI|nr:hypothetical protein M404DRAFT_997535 [Pisolithus tinctorius Marx 270]
MATNLQNGANVDPDQLFTKYTIAEVREKQIQLSADAEAKQEELRVMVGERYRELLQSSTVIISLASSAKRVHDALDEIRDAIQSQQRPPVRNRVSNIAKHDSHLHTLQVLCAHIKLLLDAPEQLWRLIEREKYFQAAWLFLLARVVHRALIRDDAQDEESWLNQGVDVLEQFPLIQRQWESVSHFRTQIIHRATLSLRATEKSYEDTCATLLTLHILESRPLTDTLTIYLSQRTKTLNALLSKGSEVSGKSVHNGRPADARTTGISTHFHTKDEVKRSVQSLLAVISDTLNISRKIFAAPSAKPLATQVLEYIQEDSPSTPAQTLPVGFLVNTQTIIAMLPSSTYLSLLPPNIKSYKPFVDLSSSSSNLCIETLEEKLGDWFTYSTANLRDAIQRALSSLQSVVGAWRVRLALKKWISRCGLNDDEQSVLSRLVDEAAGERIMSIWKSALVRAEGAFVEQLKVIRPEEVEEFPPLHSMYSPLPVLAHPPPGSGPSSFELSFQALRAHLTRRLQGRTPRLQEVLTLLEDTAVAVQRDLSRISGKEEPNQLIDDLVEAYRPEAENLCSKIVDTLTESIDRLVKNLDLDPGAKCLVFHGRLALELSTSSFASGIGCGHARESDFRQETAALFARVMERWKDHAASSEIARYTEGIIALRSRLTVIASARPSLLMLECLYSLSSSLHTLGLVHHSLPFSRVAFETLTKFSASFVDAVNDGLFLDYHQALFDFYLLRRVISTWGRDSEVLLDKAIAHAEAELRSPGQSHHDLDRSASETLARTQMLITALLPVSSTQPANDSGDKLAALLSHGVPNVDATFIPAVNLTQPSSRFPLLLIDRR